MLTKSPLTVEYLEEHGYIHDVELEEYHQEHGRCGYLILISNDNRIILQNKANLPSTYEYPAWNIHVDNEDMESIASFDVNSLEDANTILGVYNLKI